MNRKEYSVSAWIEPLINQVEEHLTLAISVYQNLPEDQLLTTPLDGGWSVAQCLEHLNSYGNFYLPAVQKALNKISTSDKPDALYKSSWFGNYFINMMKPDNKKHFKAFKGHVPARELDGNAVVAEFIQQQEQWLTLLRSVKQINQLNTRVPISISPFIRLKLGDVFGFVKAHNDRHIQQANRVLAAQPIPLALRR